MKKLLIGGLLLTLLSGCSPNTKEIDGMKYIEKVNIADKGFIYVFIDSNGDKEGYAIDKNDEFNLEVNRTYNLLITKESIIFNSGYIQKAKLVK